MTEVCLRENAKTSLAETRAIVIVTANDPVLAPTTVATDVVAGDPVLAPAAEIVVPAETAAPTETSADAVAAETGQTGVVIGPIGRGVMRAAVLGIKLIEKRVLIKVRRNFQPLLSLMYRPTNIPCPLPNLLCNPTKEFLNLLLLLLFTLLREYP